MPTVQLSLAISADQFLDYYRGIATQVFATADDGRTIQFPASLLQKHLRKEGIIGRFVLIYDENNKAVSLERLSSTSPS